MFRLESEEDKQFYYDQRQTLDEIQQIALDGYIKSLTFERHIELQILEWENQRYMESLSDHQESKVMVTSESEDIKIRSEDFERRLVELSHHQRGLNEQINELIQLKQPVQHETTYVVPNIRQPGSKKNIILTTTSTGPKLSYDAFTKQLYSCDSIHIEHLMKHERERMLDNLIHLEKSIQDIISSIDSEEIKAETRENIAAVEKLIDEINTNDRMAYMTFIEQLHLQQRLRAMDSEKTREIEEIDYEYDLIERKIGQLQESLLTDLEGLRQRHQTDLESSTAELQKQRKNLQAKQRLLTRQEKQLATSSQALRSKVLLNTIRGDDENKNPNKFSFKMNQGRSSSEAMKKVDKTIRLEDTVNLAKERYINLERRNRLEIEGYESEITQLRKRLAQLERNYNLAKRMSRI